jgi:hypothetical protein
MSRRSPPAPLQLPATPERYDPVSERARNQSIVAADGRNYKRGADIEVVGNRIILRSADGTRRALLMADDGTLSTSAPL